MKKLTNVLLLAAGILASTWAIQPAQAQKKAAKEKEGKAEKLGWMLGAQAYTFNRFTLAQALDKMDSCGIHYVECYQGQTLGGDLEGKMDYNMDAAKREKLLLLFSQKNKKLVAFGVVSPQDENDWKKVFDFAKAMQIQVITAEPRKEHLDLVSALCDQYQIKVAIHDHPKPSPYWHPDTVLAAIEGRSKLLGACADIGHWVRSGLDPVECIQKLKGHVMSLHIKDMHEKSPKAHDVIWGKGHSNIPGVLETLKAQGFKGLFSAEYEYNWLNSVPEVKASAAFWRETVNKL